MSGDVVSGGRAGGPARADPTLAGRRVLITGGSSGIGLTCARRLVGAGARVALLSRGGEGLREASASLPGVLCVEADVAAADALARAVGETVAALGGLDVVVAASGAATYGPFSRMTADDYRRTIETTLIGAVNTAHVTIPELERSGGVLVVLGSIAGRVPTPFLSAYAAAKYGVRGFVRSLDCELRAMGSRARLVVVAPGPVDTPFWKRARTPDGRLPPQIAGAYTPGDVAEEVLRAIRRPQRAERTVGGLMSAGALIDSLFPNLSLRVIALGARLGWRRRHTRPRSQTDGLGSPAAQAQTRGGLRARRSVVSQLRRRGL
jgi:NAD(P)-dependent dehydrogenase (short-subunit alcohol dehydrogenase family)